MEKRRAVDVAAASLEHPKVPNKAVCAWLFYEDGRGANGVPTHTCQKCGKGQIAGNASGYRNLISHLCSDCGIPDHKVNDPLYDAAMQPIWRDHKAHQDAEKEGRNSIVEQAVPKKVSNIYGWIRLVVKCNNPLSVCEHPIYREVVKMQGISRKTLRKYIVMLADIVGLKIRECVGPGNCIADGWSCAGTHYFAVIHRWPAKWDSTDDAVGPSNCQGHG